MTDLDIDKAIATAVKTGRVSFGANSAIQNAKTGKAKLIILASNCPKNVRDDVEYYGKISDVPLLVHRGSSMDLAAICGKPFIISALSIRELGDSEIMKAVKNTEPEEFHGGNE
ncbi:MAG: 50S ribosomal protein L30e [Candidatus Bathyarchaeota archaeon]|nr:50S ribosomal protein L30e [Candidatus Bathyarchaeota archaeon]MDH5788005.1 50S ribosomal protein L30e [Candidatus Bathyarchaeota archaeon]